MLIAAICVGLVTAYHLGIRAGKPGTTAVVRTGFREVSDWSHQGCRRIRGPDQGRPGASSQDPAADPQSGILCGDFFWPTTLPHPHFPIFSTADP